MRGRKPCVNPYQQNPPKQNPGLHAAPTNCISLPREHHSSSVLRRFVRKLLTRPTNPISPCHYHHFNAYVRRELPKLVADHILRYPHVVIDLAVMDLEDQANEIGENGRGSCLGSDRWGTFSSLDTGDGQAAMRSAFKMGQEEQKDSYGRRLGPGGTCQQKIFLVQKNRAYLSRPSAQRVLLLVSS